MVALLFAFAFALGFLSYRLWKVEKEYDAALTMVAAYLSAKHMNAAEMSRVAEAYIRRKQATR